MNTDQNTPVKPVLLDRLIDELFDTAVALGESKDLAEQLRLSARAEEVKLTLHRLWVSSDKVYFLF